MTADLYPRFVAHLGAYAQGEAHAVTAATLTAVLGLPNSEQGKRVIRACAQQAVQAGVLVCSSGAGYFVPTSPQEVMASRSRLLSDSFELRARANKLAELAATHFDLREVEAPEPDRPALLALMEVPA